MCIKQTGDRESGGGGGEPQSWVQGFCVIFVPRPSQSLPFLPVPPRPEAGPSDPPGSDTSLPSFPVLQSPHDFAPKDTGQQGRGDQAGRLCTLEASSWDLSTCLYQPHLRQGPRLCSPRNRGHAHTGVKEGGPRMEGAPDLEEGGEAGCPWRETRDTTGWGGRHVGGSRWKAAGGKSRWGPWVCRWKQDTRPWAEGACVA